MDRQIAIGSLQRLNGDPLLRVKVINPPHLIFVFGLSGGEEQPTVPGLFPSQSPALRQFHMIIKGVANSLSRVFSFSNSSFLTC